MPCKKTPVFPQLFLCLSRACLGKMMAFSVENGIAQKKRRRFLTCSCRYLMPFSLCEKTYENTHRGTYTGTHT